MWGPKWLPIQSGLLVDEQGGLLQKEKQQESATRLNNLSHKELKPGPEFIQNKRSKEVSESPTETGHN